MKALRFHSPLFIYHIVAEKRCYSFALTWELETVCHFLLLKREIRKNSFPTKVRRYADFVSSTWTLNWSNKALYSCCKSFSFFIFLLLCFSRCTPKSVAIYTTKTKMKLNSLGMLGICLHFITLSSRRRFRHNLRKTMKNWLTAGHDWVQTIKMRWEMRQLFGMGTDQVNVS